jgi:hypothetical protein
MTDHAPFNADLGDSDPGDVDRILGALRGPDPPAAPPALPDERPLWRRPASALAAAVLLAVGVGTLAGPRDPVRTRGVGNTEPQVELRVVVDDGGRAERVRRTQDYPVGQQVFFGVSAEPQTAVSLWVDGPTGREVVTRVDAGPSLQTLPTAYVLDQAGTWTFRLAAAPVGVCPPESCDQVMVTVR